MIYGLAEAEKANHKAGATCGVLKVPKGGYYGWRHRPPSRRDRADAALAGRIGRVHRDGRETHGAPRVHAELRPSGVRCGRKRVAGLMRKAGLVGCGGRRRRRVRTTRPFAPLVRTPPRRRPRPPTLSGVRARRVLPQGGGLLVDGDPQSPGPAAGLVHHSDRGSQYTSVEFGGRLKEAGLLPSTGSAADAHDNALAESFVSTPKRELLHRHSWPSREEGAGVGIFEYVECFCNPRRRHSSLGQTSPAEYEEARMKGAAVA